MDTTQPSPEITQSAQVVTSNARRSPVDPLYTNARSHSGNHLIPVSPFPRRFSRDRVSWMTGSQTSLHDEPISIHHEDGSLLRSSSSTTLHNYHGGYQTSTPDLRAHASPSPLHPTFGAEAETSFGYHGVRSNPQSAHIHFDINNLGHQHSPYSIKSPSQLSVSQKSFNSRCSTGRSYRQYDGPPARDRTPTPDFVAPSLRSRSSTSLNAAEQGVSAAPAIIIAPPGTDDPNQPGQPITIGNRFSPMSTGNVLRYDNRKTRPPSGQDCKIDAMSYWYPETPDVPQGWTAYRHPEGALYFVHGESKTITEVNICDPGIQEDIEYFSNFLFSELRKEIKDSNLSESLKVDDIQLVLEPKNDDLGVMCCYYFVNPPKRSLFWLDEWDGVDIFKHCRGGLSPTHKGLAIQAQFWCATCVSNLLNHWDLYPNVFKVTQELKDEVVDMILHATCDHLTSGSSACPSSAKELKYHLTVVDRINPEKTDERGHSAVIIGRIMHTFYHAYFLNYYGEDCARLNSDQTVYGWTYQPSLLMTICAPLFLFMAPVNNVRLLHKLFVDDLVSKEKWNMFMNKLNTQLQETSVLATVLLNANVALLSKQSNTGTPLQEYFIYMSLVASMASIVLGLVFMGNSRTEERNTPGQAANFLHGLRREKRGLETLAVIYSLPHVFLMWGMLLFFIAFAIQWVLGGNTSSWACVGAFMLVATLVVVWCIWTARDRAGLWWFQPDSNQTRRREEEGASWLRILQRMTSFKAKAQSYTMEK